MLTKEVDSDLIPVSEEYTPEQTITEDNVTYTLNDCTVLDDSEEVKNYTSYIDYLDEAAIPDSKVITVTGENGEKLQLQGKVAKKEVISNGEWLNTQITITFDHYDSGEYVWQGETIYNSSNPLEGHYAELLQSVGADSNTHRITSTQWSGDAYRSGWSDLPGCNSKRAILCTIYQSNIRSFTGICKISCHLCGRNRSR